MTDVTAVTLMAAMRGLQERQRATADNIANIQTPGYQARKVDFESALQGAISDAQQSSFSTGAPVIPDLNNVIQGGVTGDPSREDGNNVLLDREQTLGMETKLQYSLVQRALESRYTGLRDVLRSV